METQKSAAARLPYIETLVLTAAWWTEGSILLPPVLSWLPSGPRVTGGPIVMIVQVVVAPFAILEWLEAGTAKFLWVPLGVVACAVTLCPTIRLRTKILVTAVAVVAYILAVRWAATFTL